VPRLLTPDKKRNRETPSEQCLTLFKRNSKEFLRRFVTVDETWIHWYTPETKAQSKQWTSRGREGDGYRFLDSQGVIYIDYLEKGKAVTGLYYAELLSRFAAELQEIRPHFAKKKVLFHHDIAPAHTSSLAKAKLVIGYVEKYIATFPKFSIFFWRCPSMYIRNFFTAKMTARHSCSVTV